MVEIKITWLTYIQMQRKIMDFIVMYEDHSINKLQKT